MSRPDLGANGREKILAMFNDDWKSGNLDEAKLKKKYGSPFWFAFETSIPCPPASRFMPDYEDLHTRIEYQWIEHGEDDFEFIAFNMIKIKPENRRIPEIGDTFAFIDRQYEVHDVNFKNNKRPATGLIKAKPL